MELRAGNTALQNPPPSALFNTTAHHSSSLAGALRGCLGSLDGACIEKLLLHCAAALETNDVTLAQQVMWVLNNVASSNGDPNQRLTFWFLRALISRVSRVCPTSLNFTAGSTTSRLMSVTELAGYVDLIPWYRFGFSASNGAIFRAIEGCSRVHILDFSISHCMQWPTLIDALAKRPEGPPSVRITVPEFRPPVPPLLNVSSEEVCLRLANFAKLRDVPFEFNILASPESSDQILKSPFESILLGQLTPSAVGLRDDEALIVNCQNWLRYLSDHHHEQRSSSASVRGGFIEAVRNLNPDLVIAVDEDSDLSSSSLSSRITTCFNYLWIPFDALETFLPKESAQRTEYESDIGHKIENIISCEGAQRIERVESGGRLCERMKKAGFMEVGFSEETVGEVRGVLEEHASGWGMKRDEDTLVLTWKGHNSVFATAWVPIPSSTATTS